jgi:hypothetical protein
MRITIDTSEISDEQKQTEKFKSAYRDMYNQLSAPGFIPVLCAHEAAHALFFGTLGVKDFDTHTAKLWFDPKINDYRGHLAAVQPRDVPPWTEGDFFDWFMKIACAHAAGGVFSRRKMPSSDGGDQDDRERFENLCKSINERDKNVNLDWKEWWGKAQEHIGYMLDNDPTMMNTIDKVAEDFRPDLGF